MTTRASHLLFAVLPLLVTVAVAAGANATEPSAAVHFNGGSSAAGSGGEDAVTAPLLRNVICPLKCLCDGRRAVRCERLSADEAERLFADESSNFTRNFANTLTHLTLRRSDVRDLRFVGASFTRLMELDLAENAVERVECAANVLLPSVTRLILSGNRISSISRDAFVAFGNAEEIHLDHNGIFSIDWEAFRLFQLKRLLLAHNHLPTINEHMLRFTPNLEWLDLSHNQLTLAQSSSFFAAQRLARLDLGHNRIQRFYYDSFAPLFQLEWVSLAFNNLSEIPTDLRQFIALRALNLSGNPLQRIADGELVQPLLQMLDVSHCPQLMVVESGAFGRVPNLQTAIFANNSRLTYLSPTAFHRSAVLFELNLANSALAALDERLVRLPTRLHVAGNRRWRCACVAAVLRRHQRHVVDASQVWCRDAGGAARRLADADDNADGDTCGAAAPLLPVGDTLSAEIGSPLSIYCAPENVSASILWTLPNGTQLLASPPPLLLAGGGTSEANSAGSAASNVSFPSWRSASVAGHGGVSTSAEVMTPSTAQFGAVGGSPVVDGRMSSGGRRFSGFLKRPGSAGRVEVSNERLQLEIVTAEDAGEYVCRVVASTDPRHAAASARMANSTMARIRVQVVEPGIRLRVVDAGSHYVALAWNASLRVRNTRRVTLSLDVHGSEDKNGDGTSDASRRSPRLARSIQLSLYNPWLSYNVMRLRPITNYTFCLNYRLLADDEGGSPLGSGGGRRLLEVGVYPPSAAAFARHADQTLYETCVSTRTSDAAAFWSSLSASTLASMAVAMGGCAAFLTLRALYLRFYIWHDTKLRARMNESMSGQSFLSHSSSTHNNGIACGGVGGGGGAAASTSSVAGTLSASQSMVLENTSQTLRQLSDLRTVHSFGRASTRRNHCFGGDGSGDCESARERRHFRVSQSPCRDDGGGGNSSMSYRDDCANGKYYYYYNRRRWQQNSRLMNSASEDDATALSSSSSSWMTRPDGRWHAGSGRTPLQQPELTGAVASSSMKDMAV